MLVGARLYDEIDQINLEYAARMAKNIEVVESMLSVPFDDLALFLTKVPGKRVLDAGCGAGRYVSCFISAGIEYTGIDYSPDMVKVAQERNPAQDFRVLDFGALCTEFGKESFDGIWACCVFGGMTKASLLGKLAQMFDVLKHGGIAVMLLPLALETMEEVCDTDHGPMYYTSWEMSEFRNYLEEAGFILADLEIHYHRGCMTFLLMK